MKKFIFALLSTSFAIQADCFDCSSMGMYFFPEQENISTNSHFLIEGYAISQDTIESFKNRKVFLETFTGERVGLVVVELLNCIKDSLV